MKKLIDKFLAIIKELQIQMSRNFRESQKKHKAELSSRFPMKKTDFCKLSHVPDPWFALKVHNSEATNLLAGIDVSEPALTKFSQ